MYKQIKAETGFLPLFFPLFFPFLMPFRVLFQKPRISIPDFVLSPTSNNAVAALLTY